MTATATADPTTATASAFAVPLPPGCLACYGCGIAVQQTGTAGPVIEVEATSRAGSPVQPLNPLVIELLRCAQCAERLDRAEALVDAHPRAVAAIGSREAAVHRVECALIGLAVIGQPAPDPTIADADLGALVRHLTLPGALARWSARLAPTMAADASPATCTPTPWAHVTIDQRAATREGAARSLAERVARSAPQVAIAPPRLPRFAGSVVPVPGGCLMCGVASQSLSAVEVQRAGGRDAAAHSLWTAFTCSVESLGGRRSPQSVTGHLCRDCDHAVDEEGAIGPTALERALVTFVAPESLGLVERGALDMGRIVGWGASPAASQPNATRWAHLTDQAGLDALGERLRSLSAQ